MRNYILDRKYLVTGSEGSVGYQEKYLRGDYWYKVDKYSGEGEMEHLVAKILRCSTVPESCYVYYERCLINNKLGCKSKTFLRQDEMFLSFNKLYTYMDSGKLSDKIWSLRDNRERLNYLLYFVKSITGLDIFVYLKTIILLDMLTCNRDRHFNNLGVVYNYRTKTFRLSPIFDNGLSGGVGLGYGEVSSSCTISGFFEEQVVAFGYPVNSTFIIDYNRLYREVDIRRYSIIFNNLEKYKSIFRR